MHYVSDFEIIIAACTGVVVLMLQSLNLWKSFGTGKQTKRNAKAIDALRGNDDDLRAQIEMLETTVAGMKRTLDARAAAKPFGRRASDAPEMRAPTPTISEPTQPPSNWPIA